MISDQQLSERMAAGDQEAFEMLVTRYHGPLLSYTTQRLADRQKPRISFRKRLSGSFGI